MTPENLPVVWKYRLRVMATTVPKTETCFDIWRITNAVYLLTYLHWKWQLKWCMCSLGYIKSGITLACRLNTPKVRIFIMAGVGHIWFGYYVITDRMAGKHLGDFSCPDTHWQKQSEKSPQHHFARYRTIWNNNGWQRNDAVRNNDGNVLMSWCPTWWRSDVSMTKLPSASSCGRMPSSTTRNDNTEFLLSSSSLSDTEENQT